MFFLLFGCLKSDKICCREPIGTSAGVFELKPSCRSEYNSFFYHYSKTDMSKAEELQRKDRRDDNLEIRGTCGFESMRSLLYRSTCRFSLSTAVAASIRRSVLVHCRRLRMRCDASNFDEHLETGQGVRSISYRRPTSSSIARHRSGASRRDSATRSELAA